MASKQCPHCRYDRLDTTHYHEEELDVCRSCGGLWFEHGELNGMLSSVDNGEDDANFEELLGPYLSETQLLCPDCRSPLHKHLLLNDFDVTVDLCNSCNGVWVEQEALEKVEHSPKIRSALDDLNKSISVKTWLFQAVSRFPVEYNVKPHRKPVITWSLIFLNCLIFSLYGFQPGSEMSVFEHFASRPSDLAQGHELWTPLTAIFLHGDFLHLAGNMYFLYVIGDNLEDVLGRARFLVIYLLCGIASSLISVLMNWGGQIASVGASGAIAALFGMYVIWFRYASLTFMFFVYQKKLSPVWYFAIWLVVDNLFAMIMGGRGIDYWAHIGGFVIGLATGWTLKSYIYRSNPIVRILAEESVSIKR